MESKKGLNFGLVIIAFILGIALFKHFDFKSFIFRKPVLDIFYLIVFAISIYLIIKDYKKSKIKND